MQTKAKARRRSSSPTSDAQNVINGRMSRKRLALLIDNNFTEQDFTLHLTYGEWFIPKDDAEVKRILQNFMRRARRLYKRRGMKLKYICVTERSKCDGSYRHRLIVSGGVPGYELGRLWKVGGALAVRYDIDSGFIEYAFGSRLFFRRWNGSRNLEC